MSIDKYLEEKAKRKGAIVTRRLSSLQSGLKWKKGYCQSCQKMVQYVPKKDWDGRLVCPHCKKWFRVPLIDTI